MVKDYYTSESRFAIQASCHKAGPPYAVNMGFKERLVEARGKLSQTQLGDLLDCSKQTISHWENGRYEPNIGQLQKLCDVLDCSADWLIMGRAPEGLHPDAIREGKFYASLGPEAKKKWQTMRLLIVDPASDKHVEKRMPITARSKEKQ
jgi:transcriptional regulator with XRE-family HTH domain